jgi:Peptidase A4 family
VLDAKKLWPVLAVGILVVATIAFFAVLTPGSTAVTSIGAPAVGSPTHYGHPLVSAVSSTGSSGAGPLGCPLLAKYCYYSYNWAGYAVLAPADNVKMVTGSWTVPTILGSTSTKCPDTQRDWESNSVWVGIDGFSSGTVEQTGTSADCFYGYTMYYAWYEFYPSGSVVSSMTVSPGDKITATVTYTGLNTTGVPTFKSSLTDTTTGVTFNSPRTAVPSAMRASAEWIDESPYYMGFLGLTHVSADVAFTGASATLGAVTNTLSGWGNKVVWILSVDYEFPYDSILYFAKAQPQAISGSAFHVKYLSGGP